MEKGWLDIIKKHFFTLPEVNNSLTQPKGGLLPQTKIKIPNNRLVGGNTGVSQAEKIGDISTGINLLSNLASGFIKEGEDTSSFQQKQIGNFALQSKNPYIKAAGAAWNTLSTIGDLTDTNSSRMSDAQQEAVGTSNFIQRLNNVLTYVPMAGAFMKKTAEVNKNDNVDMAAGSFSDSVNFINNMSSMGGKRYVIGNKANAKANTANEYAKQISAIYNTTSLRKNSNVDQELQHQINQRYGLYAKEGIKLLSKKELNKIYTRKTGISKFQDGGSILIPDGALHKNKHNMEDVNPELAKELTNKGIPVILTDEKGKVQQCAEIEKNEMILEKSLTDRVEELWKKGDEESMIKCGKLIVETLFTNCDDNTGLIKEVE